MSAEIEVHSDPAAACAELIVAAVRPGAHLVLTGGSTPRVAYERAARVDVQWAGTTLWFGDERCVPPNDKRSNYRMAKLALFDAIGGDRRPTVCRMQGELGPFAGADDYQRALIEADFERFDLLLLGIGPDGHTASLFPNAPQLDELERQVVGVPEAGFEPFVPRISLSIPALLRAERTVFIAAGESKAAPVAAAFGGDAAPDPAVPASLVAAAARRVTVLLDEAAAARL